MMSGKGNPNGNGFFDKTKSMINNNPIAKSGQRLVQRSSEGQNNDHLKGLDWNYYNTLAGSIAHFVVGILIIGLGFGLTSSTVNKGFLILRPYEDILISNSTNGVWNSDDFISWPYPWVPLCGIGFLVASILYLVEFLSAFLGKNPGAEYSLNYIKNFIHCRQNIYQWLRIAIINIFLNINWLFIVGQGEMGQMFLMTGMCFLNAMMGWIQEILVFHEEVREKQQNNEMQNPPKPLYTKMGFGLFVISWAYIFVTRFVYLIYDAEHNSLWWWVWFTFFLMMLYEIFGILMILGFRTWRYKVGKQYFYYSLLLNACNYFTVVIVFFMTGPNFYTGY